MAESVVANKAMVEEIILGLAAALGSEAITTGSKVRNPSLSMFIQAKLCLEERRLNVYVKDQIDRRKHLFQPKLELNAFESSCEAVLRSYFDGPTEMNVAFIDKTVKPLTMFINIKLIQWMKLASYWRQWR